MGVGEGWVSRLDNREGKGRELLLFEMGFIYLTV